MKIGYDAKRFFHNATGLGNYSRSLIEVLSRFYPENEYLLYNPKKSKKYDLDTYPKIVIEKTPLGFLYNKFKSLWRLVFITNQIKKDKLNIYHGLSGEIPLFLSKNCKKVVTIHDLIFIRYPELYTFFDKKIHEWKFKYAANNSDIIVAISEQTKKDLIDFFGINPDKIKVIYQGCNAVFKETYSKQEKTEVIKKYNLPKDFILNVGTIEKRKNALTIVKAIKNTSIPLVLIGKKTKYYSEIETFIEENKMNGQVLCLKGLTIKELAILYQAATLFIYPSIFEGFGIPIIEALYSGTPVISSTGGCFSEAGGASTIYINPEDDVALYAEILKLWNNEDTRNEISQKGKEFARQFNDEIIAHHWQMLYKSILKERKYNKSKKVK